MIEPRPVSASRRPSLFRDFALRGLILVVAIAGGLFFGFSARAGRPAEVALRPSIAPEATIASNAFIPPIPAGRSLHFVPIDMFPNSDVDALVNHFRTKYGLEVRVEPRIPASRETFDFARSQTQAELLVHVLRDLPVAADPNAVIIGLTAGDIYIAARQDWRFAYGLRETDRFAVISSARLDGHPPNAELRMERVRKMVTKYVGVQFYRLPESSNPRSVLYNNILGPDDLDRMSEEFILDSPPTG